MNVVDLFLTAADRYPEYTAFSHQEEQVTYRELKERVISLAGEYQKQGLQSGDRILVFVPMSIRLYTSVLALLYCGAVAVFVEEWADRKRLIQSCKLAECKGMVGDRKLRWLSRFHPALMGLKHRLKPEAKSMTLGKKVELTADDSALISFTSGTTGTPKAADRTHGFLKEQFDALNQVLKANQETVDMCTFPVVVFYNLGKGAHTLLPFWNLKNKDDFDAYELGKLLTKYRVNRMTAAPFYCIRLAETHVNLLIKEVFTGGACVLPSDAELLQRAFSDAHVRVIYGSTEVEPVSMIDADSLIGKSKKKVGICVGKPVDIADVKVVWYQKEEWQELTEKELEDQVLPTGELGEIIVKGPHVLRKYFKNQEALKRSKVFVGDEVYHRTGDSGYLSEDGMIYLVGRCQDEEDVNIAPFEMEKQVSDRLEGRKGTVIRKNGKAILVLEGEEKVDTFQEGIDLIEYLEELPRDKRHHSRIDYDRLIKMI